MPWWLLLGQPLRAVSPYDAPTPKNLPLQKHLLKKRRYLGQTGLGTIALGPWQLVPTLYTG